jgi:hypothetical protein
MLMTGFRCREILVVEHGGKKAFHQLAAPQSVA